jgi:hypothetical protein
MNANNQTMEYFVLSYVPDEINEEAVNIGVMLIDAGGGQFAGVRFRRNWKRVEDIDSDADLDYLLAIERDLQQQLKDTEGRGIFLNRILESFSADVRITRGSAMQTANPAQLLDLLTEQYLADKRPGPREKKHHGHAWLVHKMQEAFDISGVGDLIMKKIPVAPYTHIGDPLKFDFGYRVGKHLKIFQAVSFHSGVESAITLAARYPNIRGQIAPLLSAEPHLVAIVEDDLQQGLEANAFALAMMKEANISVSPLAEMPHYAQVAHDELQA